MHNPEGGKDEKPSERIDIAVRERLIRAAIGSFARLGFDGASLRMIAQEAGVAFQLIAYYFGSKEDLWSAAVDRLFDERRKATKAAFSPARNYETQLRSWLQTTIAFHQEHPELRQIVCQEYMADSRRYEKQLRPVLRDTAPHSAFFFDQAGHLGIPTAFSTTEIQLVFRGILVAAAIAPGEIQLAIDGDDGRKLSVADLAELVLNLFLRGAVASSERPRPSLDEKEPAMATPAPSVA